MYTVKTHIDIDEHVLGVVQKLGRFATKREAVHAALTDMARRLSARQLLDMRGQLDIDAEPPSLRESRFPAWDAGQAS